MATKPIQFVEKPEFIPVDQWEPGEQDLVLKHTKGAIIMPISEIYKTDNTTFNYFVVSTKRCYNSPEMRAHCTKYLNYLMKFYDRDKELLMIYSQIKFLMDFEPNYTKESLFYDIHKYILSGSMMYKITLMNRDNYMLSLKYMDKKDPSIHYTAKHASMLMKLSLIINVLIPILTHFIYVKKIANSNHFLLEAFDHVLTLFDVDIFNKLYETSLSNVNKSKHQNPIWNRQDIRGINNTTHAISSVYNIFLQIVPKYEYDKNIIHLNYRSILNNITYQVTDIGYEYNFISLSSSKRDVENNSEFDRFESYLAKQDEGLYLQNKVNCEETMKMLELMFGPFDREEINFYIEQLSEGYNRVVINSFQKELIFNLFYKYFGDVVSIKAINIEDYVKLMIIAKKILQANNMVILPYVISSRITKLVPRKNVNKKELTKLEQSTYFPYMVNKYKNNKIQKYILSIIATILSSEFKIIDYMEDELNNNNLTVFPDILLEEVMMMISLI